jgi:O-glycosyl hydrolase
MEVTELVVHAPIFEPYISVQPQSYALNTAGFTAPTLNVEVAEWNSKDGSLSYQWYAFTELKDYYKGVVQPVAGATSQSFTPANVTAEAGKTYYYYVVVTNTNSNAIPTDPDDPESGKTAIIQSEVAVITFNTEGSPATPVITQNPADAAYIMGRQAALASLEVRTGEIPAVSGVTSSIQYQWYSFKLTGVDTADFNTDGTPKGILLSGATSRTYLPSASDLSKGDTFYYVIASHVTANAGGDETGRTSVLSIPAKITMMPGERAISPRITAQPKDLMYFTTDVIASAASLSVTAESVDGGTLTYQWYSKATPQALTGTEITGATSASYKPATVGAAGTTYYYVIVTNTVDPDAVETDQITAEATSNTVPIKVRAQGAVPAANATITVTPATKYQYIRGYGGMETTWGNFYQSDPEDMENMFNPDILGYNIWRIMIPPVSTKMEGDGSLDTYVMSRNYTNRYYENPKIVNKYNGYVLASPWSPPKEWKSNNSINSGGHLIPRYYKQYANYLRSFARHMANKGAPLYAVSIANEPNYAGGYDGCEWTPEEMRNFFKEVGRYTQGVRGFGGGKQTPFVLTVNGESANNPNINNAAMNDPASNAAIDLFARHVYGEQREVLWGNSKLNGREVWMTEHNINSATATAFPNDWTYNYVWRFMNDVDLVIRLNNENAFVWWVVKRFYSFIGEGDAYTSVHAILPRAWGMAHYSKFTIDTTRVGVNVAGTLGTGGAVSASNVNNNTFDLDNLSVRVTAFISKDNKEISLVMWTPTGVSGSGGYALGTAQMTMPDNGTIRSVTALRSQSTGGGTSGLVTNMGQAADSDVTISADRKTAYFALPAAQMLSVKFILE